VTCPSCDEEVDQVCSSCKSCDACCECDDEVERFVGEFEDEEEEQECDV